MIDYDERQAPMVQFLPRRPRRCTVPARSWRGRRPQATCASP